MLRRLPLTYSWVGIAFFMGLAYSAPAFAINAHCGTAAGTWTSSAAPPTSALCSAGTPTAVVGNNASSYVWTCRGTDGGTTSYCAAQRTLTNGACGSAAGTCASGFASAVTTASGKITWKCSGKYNGTTASCSASAVGSAPTTPTPTTDTTTDTTPTPPPATNSTAMGATGALVNGVNYGTGINVRSYGAKGDGSTNDSAAFKTAISKVTAGGTLYVPPGTYMIDAVGAPISLKANMTLSLAAGATLKARPNGSGSYAVVKVNPSASNVVISGGTIMGDVGSHTGTGGEWGMGIGIWGAKNVTISNMKIMKCWGDGIYVASNATTIPENIVISNVWADYNRRQGLSIIAGNNVQVLNSTFTNTTGTTPGAGIDVEPNKNTDYVQNILIKNVVTKNNVGKGKTTGFKGGAGIQFFLTQLKGTTKPISITLENVYDDGSVIGLLFDDEDNLVPGTITVKNGKFENSWSQGIYILRHRADGYKITLTNPTVINNNVMNTSGNGGSAIFMHGGDKQSVAGGNVVITNPILKGTARTLPYGHFFRGVNGLRNISVTNPTYAGVSTRCYASTSGVTVNGGGCVK